MEIKDLRDHLDERIDRLENKLDDHLGRISKAEESIEWLKGHVKVSISILLAFVTGLVGAFYKFILK